MDYKDRIRALREDMNYISGVSNKRNKFPAE